MKKTERKKRRSNVEDTCKICGSVLSSRDKATYRSYCDNCFGGSPDVRSPASINCRDGKTLRVMIES